MRLTQGRYCNVNTRHDAYVSAVQPYKAGLAGGAGAGADDTGGGNGPVRPLATTVAELATTNEVQSRGLPSFARRLHDIMAARPPALAAAAAHSATHTAHGRPDSGATSPDGESLAEGGYGLGSDVVGASSSGAGAGSGTGAAHASSHRQEAADVDAIAFEVQEAREEGTGKAMHTHRYPTGAAGMQHRSGTAHAVSYDVRGDDVSASASGFASTSSSGAFGYDAEGNFVDDEDDGEEASDVVSGDVDVAAAIRQRAAEVRSVRARLRSEARMRAGLPPSSSRSRQPHRAPHGTPAGQASATAAALTAGTAGAGPGSAAGEEVYVIPGPALRERTAGGGKGDVAGRGDVAPAASAYAYSGSSSSYSSSSTSSGEAGLYGVGRGSATTSPTKGASILRSGMYFPVKERPMGRIVFEG